MTKTIMEQSNFVLSQTPFVLYVQYACISFDSIAILFEFYNSHMTNVVTHQY